MGFYLHRGKGLFSAYLMKLRERGDLKSLPNLQLWHDEGFFYFMASESQTRELINIFRVNFLLASTSQHRYECNIPLSTLLIKLMIYSTITIPVRVRYWWKNGEVILYIFLEAAALSPESNNITILCSDAWSCKQKKAATNLMLNADRSRVIVASCRWHSHVRQLIHVWSCPNTLYEKINPCITNVCDYYTKSWRILCL